MKSIPFDITTLYDKALIKPRGANSGPFSLSKMAAVIPGFLFQIPSCTRQQTRFGAVYLEFEIPKADRAAIKPGE